MTSISLQRSSKPIAIWLLIGVGMIMIQVLLGGITRLTGSGLSITEWKPILGTLPPMNEQDWQLAFNKYKAIGQFKQINFDFTLEDFKFIYFWEWFHRVWARLIAIAFAVPFIIFSIQKRFRKEMIIPMIILFLLGGLQGAIGWIMVQSGLNEENISVNHIRLAIHFLAALGLLCYAVWFSLKLIVPEKQLVFHSFLKKGIIGILCVLVCQLLYGALMAGLKAGVEAPTWPMINERWLPDVKSGNIVNNKILVQFIHRNLAYVLTILISFWWWKSRAIKSGTLFIRMRNSLLLMVIFQVLLGIATVLYSPQPRYLLWLGVSHQFIAMILLMLVIGLVYLLGGKSFNKVS